MSNWEPDLDPRRIQKDREKAEAALKAQRDAQMTGSGPSFIGGAVSGLFKLIVGIVVLLLIGLVIAAATGNLGAIETLFGNR